MVTMETCAGLYRLCDKIGSGSFGVIYSGVNIKNGKEVAIKLECANSGHSQLACEYRVYRDLYGGVGIPRVYWFGKEGKYNVLVMEILGPSLQDLFEFCSKKFTLKTILMLADQLLVRIKWIHDRSYIHRDIKPENFLIGLEEKSINIVYVIDLGLAKLYRNPATHKHNPHKWRKWNPGTARFSSINLHLGNEQSRRDDLESIGFVLMYFNRGMLPWQGVKADTWKWKYSKIVEKKLKTSIWDLCKGFPIEFATYIKYCRALRFEQQPDYSYLRKLFRELFNRQRYVMDYRYDWVVKITPWSIIEKHESSEHQPLQKENKTPYMINRLYGSSRRRLPLLALDVNISDLNVNINKLPCICKCCRNDSS